MTEVSAAVSSVQLTNPQPVSRPRRLRHIKSPIYQSSDFRSSYTSLYQFPSEISLSSIHTSHSSVESSKLQTDARLFTAVLPPLAAGPPTVPLPPTPRKQCPQGDMKSSELLETSDRNSKVQPKVEVVVGIIKDVRAGKEHEKQKRGLRRVKGNVGAATHDDTVDLLRNASLDSTRLLTPCPTSPPAAKPITPPRTLHHPKPYKLPVRKLEYYGRKVMTKSTGVKKALLHKHGGYEDEDDDDDDDDDDDNDDGGIALDYEYEPHTFLADNKEQIPGTLWAKRPSTPGVDIPRLGSPFLPDVTLCLDEPGKRCELDAEVDYQSQYEFSSEDEGVKLSACRKLFPEIAHSPIRIDSTKVEVVTEPAPLNQFTGLSAADLVNPVASPTEQASSGVSITNPLSLNIWEENVPEATGVVTEGSPSDQRGTSDGNILINKPSTLQRRNSSDSSEVSRDPLIVLGKPYTFSEICSGPTQCIVHSPIRHCSTSDSQLIFTLPQLPRFNFIPATPLPLMSPGSTLDKQLGEHIYKDVGTVPLEEQDPLSGTTLADTALVDTRQEESIVSTVNTTRPPLSRSKTLRDSRLHPWWRPKPYYKYEEADFGKLLENTSFGPGSGESNPGMIHHIPSTDWTEYGPLKVDKKRKIVGLGGVQIQWVGLGSLYERLVCRRQETGIEKGESLQGVKPRGHKVNLKRKGWIDS